MHRLATAVGFWIFIAGCGSSSPRPSSEPRVGDRLAGDRLEVVRIERTGDSRGCIVDVVNRSGADLSLRYRVRWFSAEGREVRRGEPVWQDLRVAREGRGSLVSAVPAPWCVRFEIEFQP